ncbi:hypothetical protein Tco_1362185 [Tanacetum coccineum]
MWSRPWMVNSKPLIVQKQDIHVSLDNRVGKPMAMDAVTAIVCKNGVGKNGSNENTHSCPKNIRLENKVSDTLIGNEEQKKGENKKQMPEDEVKSKEKQVTQFAYQPKMKDVNGEKGKNDGMGAQKEGGDMNVTLAPNKQSSSSSLLTGDMNEFRDCINNIEMEDVASSGIFYTWTRYFKADKKEFLLLVKLLWEENVDGCQMFKTVKKLKGLKKDMKKLSWKNEDVFENVKKLRDKLKELQVNIDKAFDLKQLREEESIILQEYVSTKKDEEKIIYQKAKVKWLSVGIGIMPISTRF